MASHLGDASVRQSCRLRLAGNVSSARQAACRVQVVDRMSACPSTDCAVCCM